MLRAKIKRLEDVAPDQAHAMISAAYHFSNTTEPKTVRSIEFSFPYQWNNPLVRTPPPDPIPATCVIPGPPGTTEATISSNTSQETSAG